MAKKRTLASALAEIDSRVDADELLSAADREAIKEKAREHVASKRKSKAEADALAAAIEEMEREYDPKEQYEDILINLAPHVASQRFSAAFISLDGEMFFHGLSYEVRYAVARTLEDVMARGWEHEREIHGERRRADISRRPVLPHIHQGQEGMPASALNTRSSVTRV